MNLINEWSKKMAARKKKIEKPIDSIDRRCGNCALGTFLSDDSNYDREERGKRRCRNDHSVFVEYKPV